MPTMARPKNKATKIAWAILGKPANMSGYKGKAQAINLFTLNLNQPYNK